MDSKEKQKVWFSLIVGLFLTVTSLYSAVEDYIIHKTIQASRTWPVTTGVVKGVNVKYVATHSKSRQIPKITYVYHVSDSEYSCNIKIKSKEEEDAEMILKAFPIGTHIQVSYNPQKPQDCVTKYDEDEYPLGAIIFFFIGITMIIYSFTKIMRSKGYSISNYLKLSYSRLKGNM